MSTFYCNYFFCLALGGPLHSGAPWTLPTLPTPLLRHWPPIGMQITRQLMSLQGEYIPGYLPQQTRRPPQLRQWDSIGLTERMPRAIDRSTARTTFTILHDEAALLHLQRQLTTRRHAARYYTPRTCVCACSTSHQGPPEFYQPPPITNS